MNAFFYVNWDPCNNTILGTSVIPPAHYHVLPDNEMRFDCNECSKHGTPNEYWNQITAPRDVECMYMIRLHEGGEAGSYVSSTEWKVVFSIDEVFGEFENYFENHEHDEDCAMCRKRDGFTRCRAKHIGKLAKKRVVHFEDGTLYFTFYFESHEMFIKKKPIQKKSN